MSGARSFVRIWRWPLLLAALTCFGLLAALLGGGGLWWPLAWLALGIPLATIAFGVCGARRTKA
ncbi:MAG TPA: hypothetical protein VHC94_03160 [Nitrobacter sp.]|jgi:hypothetical protein|nr:hypothetical protein [Nitrobacter sp.]